MGMRRRQRRRRMVAVGAIAHHEGVKRGQQEAAAYGAPADDGYAEPAYTEPAYTEAPPEPAYAQAPPEAAYAPPAADPADELDHLAQLHASGVLTDDEFAAAKAKVLGT